MPIPVEFKTPRERQIFSTAVMFTAVRGVLTNRTRAEFPCFELAYCYAKEIGDGRTMIYAINSTGSSAHICNA